MSQRRKKQLVFDDIETREEKGTPPVLEEIRRNGQLISSQNCVYERPGSTSTQSHCASGYRMLEGGLEVSSNQRTNERIFSFRTESLDSEDIIQSRNIQQETSPQQYLELSYSAYLHK